MNMANKTLVIYDLDGTIITNPITGHYDIPNGIPYIEVVIPKGKQIIGVNVETKEAILENIPLTEIEELENKISILEKENADLLLDSANKDLKIQTIESDLADLTLEIAMGGM